MARTKKVGSTGRFGVRYGAKLRRRVLDIDRRRHEAHRCPSCATRALQRKAAGLWRCRKCGLLFTGGAYVPYTDAGRAAKRAIAQRVSDDFLSLRDDTPGDEEVPEFMKPLDSEEPVIVAEDLSDEGMSEVAEDLSDEGMSEVAEDSESTDSEQMD